MRFLIALLSLLAVTAQAQVRRATVVGAAGEGGTEAEATLAAQAVSTALQADARYEVVPAASAARDDAPTREARGVEARRLFLEAKDALDNLALPKALAAADKSIKFHEESDLSAGAQGLVDALALRAMIAMAKNDKPGFSNDAQRVLAMAPNYVWDPSRLTPAAQAVLEPLRKKAKAAPPATLTLESNPAGALAFVDGVFRGVTPVTVSGLSPGSHVVTLSAPGFELLQDRAFAGSGATAPFTLKAAARGKELLARLAEVRAATAKNEPDAAVPALARYATVDEVWVVRHSPKSLELWRVHSDGTVVGDEKGAPGSTAELVKKLAAMAAPERKQLSEPTPTALPDAPLVTQSHAGRRPIGWIAAATAVVSLGVGIGLGASSKGLAAAANKTPQVDTTTYNALASGARTQALVADVLFCVAAVAAGVSLFMLITGYSGDSDEADDEALFLVPNETGAVLGLTGRF